MPRHIHAVPKYRRRYGRLYKSGRREADQAVVTINSVDLYLGVYGTLASRLEYDRLIAEWLASGRQTARGLGEADNRILTIELCARYWKYAKNYYRKNGKCTNVAPGIRCALRYVIDWYGKQPADEFGPKALKAVREQMIRDGHCRRYVNDHIDRIKRMFKWAVSEELVLAEVHQSLATVTGLRKGKSNARETFPVLPVDEATVDITLPFLPEVLADMVRVHRLSGCRPGEICIVHPVDIDQTEDIWLYRPETYKTEGTGRERVIFFGPSAQEILLKYLVRDSRSYCFQPRESEATRLAAKHAARKTPLSCGNRPGTNRRSSPERMPGGCYTPSSYRRAIHRGCDKAFPAPGPLCQRQGETADEWNARLSKSQRVKLRQWRKQHRWSPNQLRHAAGTEVRRAFGLEAAQIILGHAGAKVTEIYAERDIAKGIEVARKIG